MVKPWIYHLLGKKKRVHIGMSIKKISLNKFREERKLKEDLEYTRGTDYLSVRCTCTYLKEAT